MATSGIDLSSLGLGNLNLDSILALLSGLGGVAATAGQAGANRGAITGQLGNLQNQQVGGSTDILGQRQQNAGLYQSRVPFQESAYNQALFNASADTNNMYANPGVYENNADLKGGLYYSPAQQAAMKYSAPEQAGNYYANGGQGLFYTGSQGAPGRPGGKAAAIGIGGLTGGSPSDPGSGEQAAINPWADPANLAKIEGDIAGVQGNQLSASAAEQQRQAAMRGGVSGAGDNATLEHIAREGQTTADQDILTSKIQQLGLSSAGAKTIADQRVAAQQAIYNNQVGANQLNANQRTGVEGATANNSVAAANTRGSSAQTQQDLAFSGLGNLLTQNQNMLTTQQGGTVGANLGFTGLNTQNNLGYAGPTNNIISQMQNSPDWLVAAIKAMQGGAQTNNNIYNGSSGSGSGSPGFGVGITLPPIFGGGPDWGSLFGNYNPWDPFGGGNGYPTPGAPPSPGLGLNPGQPPTPPPTGTSFQSPASLGYSGTNNPPNGQPNPQAAVMQPRPPVAPKLGYMNQNQGMRPNTAPGPGSGAPAYNGNTLNYANAAPGPAPARM